MLDLETLYAAGREPTAAERAELAASVAPQAVASAPRRELFQRWVWMRRASDEESLHGAKLDRIFRVARVLAWAAGLAFGASSAGGYLLYFGKEPVNPVWFFLWLVLVPVLCSLGVLAMARAWHDWSGPGAFARWVVGAVCNRLGGDARATWQAWVGVAARHRDRHAPLVVLPLVGLTQRVACGFSLGALLSLLLYVLGKDITFGWQSTVGWSAETWHAMARGIAAPWSWIFPWACPTLEQVRASQFTYAGGVAAIAPGASQAWWPFLAGCLAVWGVGLRAMVILYLGWRERVALRGLDFSHSAANALHRALTGPLIDAEPAAAHPIPAGTEPARVHHAPGRSWLLLLTDTASPEHAGQAVAHALGGAVVEVHFIAIDAPGENAQALAKVAASVSPVAVFLPAARDPILAIKKSLAAVVAASGSRECVVLLHGDASRLALWRKFFAAHRLELELIPVP